MKDWMKYLVYASLLFLVIALINGDYLSIPKIESYPYLLLSFLLLALGFFWDAYSWKVLLGKYNLHMSGSKAYLATGMVIFTKYIPGKIWSIVGRAGYTSKITSFKQADTSNAALQWQILSLLAGAFLGFTALIPFIGFVAFKPWIIALIGLVVLLSAIIFNPKFIDFCLIIVNKMFSKSIKLPYASSLDKAKTLPFLGLMWLFFSLGFYFLMMSLGVNFRDILVGNTLITNFFVGNVFALAGTLGIIAIIAPGGLGVREGILVVYLTTIDIQLEWATTIAITSRIWFLIGECLFFLSAYIIKKQHST